MCVRARVVARMSNHFMHKESAHWSIILTYTPPTHSLKKTKQKKKRTHLLRKRKKLFSHQNINDLRRRDVPNCCYSGRKQKASWCQLTSALPNLTALLLQEPAGVEGGKARGSWWYSLKHSRHCLSFCFSPGRNRLHLSTITPLHLLFIYSFKQSRCRTLPHKYESICASQRNIYVMYSLII